MSVEALDRLINPAGFQSIRVTRSNGVATIGMLPDDGLVDGKTDRERVVLFALHKDIGEALEWLGRDDLTRVVVLEGAGDAFVVPPKGGKLLQDLSAVEDWDLIEGLRRTLLAVISLAKPVIAKVNGDAIGFGSSLLYACDFIVASEDALIGDMHLGMGDLPYGNKTWGFVAGDGGAIFVPMHMTLPMAKEYLMLARTWTTRELADKGVINHAVPRAELDAKVLDMCERLMRRPPYAMAWTKRVLNRDVLQRFNAGYDAGMAFEIINVLHKRAEMHRPKDDTQ